MKAKINPDLLPLARDINTLKLDKKNARKHGKRDLEVLSGSLQTHGQQKPLVGLKDGTIIAGNGTLRAATALGWESLAVVQFDSEDEARARAFAVVDNRSAELSSWDFDMLLLELNQLPPELFPSAGFTFQEMGDLLRAEEVSDQKPGRMIFEQEKIIDSAVLYFKEHGFPYRDVSTHLAMQKINKLSMQSGEALRKSSYANDVPDRYHHHRYLLKAGTNESGTSEMKSIFDAFSDEKKLRRILKISLDNDQTVPDGWFNTIVMLSGAQVLSNFRPGFAAWLYRRFCPQGGRVLDMSTGFGGRLIGFLASDTPAEYVGIDPSSKTCEGNRRMVADFGFSDRVSIIEKPAEEVSVEEVGGSESIDFAFTSPPYFTKEHYSEESTQSWVRYKSIESWTDGFLRPMLALTFSSLKRGSHAAINIADIKLGKRVFPLSKITEEVAIDTGFLIEARESFSIGGGFASLTGNTDEAHEVDEPLLVFRKP